MLKSGVVSVASAALLAVALLSHTSPSSLVSSPLVLAEARPSCEHCLSTGRAYFCKASITSHICFDGGDAQCDHQFCVCCKDAPQGGCMACEELDEEEWQEENLEQIDEWQSHEMRDRIKRQKEEAIAARNVEIGLKAGLTPEKLEAKRVRRKAAVEAERKKLEAEGKLKKTTSSDTNDDKDEDSDDKKVTAPPSENEDTSDENSKTRTSENKNDEL